jgi:hypothetical protein
MKKFIFSRILWIFFGLCVGLLIAEGITRLMVPQAGWNPIRDDMLGWTDKEYDRFDPLSDKPDGNAHRIMFLGDSFLAGSGVTNLNQRFPIVLEKKEKNIKVGILAAGGWGTDQELLAFILKGKSWKPDLVVVAFCPDNDLSNILTNIDWSGTAGKPYFRFDSSGGIKLFSPQGIIIQNFENNIETTKRRKMPRSYFLNLIRYVYYNKKMNYSRMQRKKQHGMQIEKYSIGGYTILSDFLGEINGKTTELSLSPQNYATKSSAYIHEDFKVNSYQWKLLEAILARLKQETDGIGARLVVMLLPTPESGWYPIDLRFIAGGSAVYRIHTPTGMYTFRAHEPVDRLQAICGRKEIIFFDPSREFIKRVEKNNLVFQCWSPQDKMHFTPAGHKILADILSEYLQKHPELFIRK